MRNSLVPLFMATCLAVTSPAIAERKLADTFSAEKVDIVKVDVGTGDLELIASNDDQIEVEVVLTPRRGGFFSSKSSAEREVEQAQLTSETAGGRLLLEIASESSDRRFEEQWTVHVPSRLGLELDVGVGDVKANGLNGGILMDIGVGEVRVEVSAGDVLIDVGVGGADVKAPAQAYGSVKAEGGVGDARIKTPDERIEGEGFVGHSASWVGDGSHRIEIEVGVGEAAVILH